MGRRHACLGAPYTTREENPTIMSEGMGYGEGDAVGGHQIYSDPKNTKDLDHEKIMNC